MDTQQLIERRRRLVELLLPEQVVLLHNGSTQYKNITAASYRFRPNSNMLYFCGVLPRDTVLLCSREESIIFLRLPDITEAIFDGPPPDFDEVREKTGVDRVLSLAELQSEVTRVGARRIATVPHLNPKVTETLASLLERPVPDESSDLSLIDAIISLRLRHDQGAISQLRKAAEVTKEAFAEAHAVVRPGVYEYEVRATLEAAYARRGAGTSFETTVTVHGEILHQLRSDNKIAAGDLLLVDSGAETAEGYAADVTRTWPVGSKRISATQRDAYSLVLSMQAEAIAKARPGVSFREVHHAASRVMAAGLVDLGILQGDPDTLLERGAHALFMPHGIGHLLGLDVHDLEEFGDRAGYPSGVKREQRLDLRHLRLARTLEANMAVTIEPGLYLIPAVFKNPDLTNPLKDCLNFKAIEQFKDVRGIRIEDDLLITAAGHEILTEGIPKRLDEF